MEVKTMSDKKYLTCAETAKLLRKVLKKEFPGIKFFVRSHTYSMGASIDIDWMDGPTADQVDNVVKVYEGKDFDGMIDLGCYISHWLNPDGSVTLASSPGTEGSRGTIPGFDYPAAHPNAILVSLGADYIFTDRAVSLEMAKEAADIYHEKTGWDLPEIEESQWFVRGGLRKESKAHFKQDLSKKAEGYPHPDGHAFPPHWTQAEAYAFFASRYTNYDPKSKPKARQLGPLVNVATGPIHYNIIIEGAWTWVKFPVKPPRELLDELKGLGFHWGRRRKAWYAREALDEQKVAEVIDGFRNVGERGLEVAQGV
jgi:hypothetical protein